MQPTLKRVFDIVLALSAIIFFFPLYAFIIILIYFDAGRPIFFIQHRVGKNGKIFNLIKFRSMVKDAASKTVGLHDKEIPKKMISRVGRILRNTAMDEFPQVFNILKGDMSFVGPRATLPLEIDSLDPEERETKLSVVPGLTGVAQVYGRDDISSKQRVRFDKLYIVQHSFWIDLKLILLSVLISLKGKWKTDGKKI